MPYKGMATVDDLFKWTKAAIAGATTMIIGHVHQAGSAELSKEKGVKSYLVYMAYRDLYQVSSTELNDILTWLGELVAIAQIHVENGDIIAQAMAHTYKHQDPNLYNIKQAEIEVEIEDEQETAAAEERYGLGEILPGVTDEPRNQGVPNHQNDMNLVICNGFYITIPSQKSHQSSEQLQLKGKETSVAAGVTQPQRNSRPRIHRGVTPRQLRELEEVFEAD
ncbi:Dihydropyrimidinase-related protein 3 [Microtus ochrogaster]|uniref:Dihydropyrimidinase-related protein 3 n=1 Tax=Microtus ochrogaster TaxID=79684 RepID=A0A8J6G142_MICOH|nr:Dihydropyrimidinase-related protein 3 [Microtus ochrogaster]